MYPSGPDPVPSVKETACGVGRSQEERSTWATTGPTVGEGI